jgi:hypothetical protein
MTHRELEHRRAELTLERARRSLFFWTARGWLMLTLMTGLVIAALVRLADHGLAGAPIPWQLISH